MVGHFKSVNFQNYWNYGEELAIEDGLIFKAHWLVICTSQRAGKNEPGPSRKLTFLDKFLLVLMRLKAGLFVQDLADRFGVSTSLVFRICITWIKLLYFELKDLFPFPSQELVRKNMPDEFAEFATTRIILDCTEIFIQHPSAMLAQSETWSDFKHHNTLKQLVGGTPNGQVLSDLWGGGGCQINR